MSTWVNLEESVRQYSGYIWNRAACEKRIDGVNFDCYLEISPQEIVVVEVTENNSLSKIRGDINKINTIRINNAVKGVVVRAFIVCDYHPTKGMVEAGEESNIEVTSFIDFKKKFFDFRDYEFARRNRQFGSAVDPVTGRDDKSKYTPVKYRIDGSDQEISAEDIAAKVSEGERIVLLGDYGTGKSRCFKELFNILSENADRDLLYPIAVDLKDTWGLVNAVEIIRRHFSGLGISDDQADNVVKAYNGDSLCFLLDGFDEVGSRPWHDDQKRLVEIRKYALQGVKDILANSQAGFVVSGRDHYFNNNDEMLSALGLERKDVLIVYCKEEFDVDEFECFLDINEIDISIPSWVPKKPLILKTISSMNSDELKALFRDESDSITIWFKFVDYMCDRDARIHPVLDGRTVKKVLKLLSRRTRSKNLDYGPISEAEIYEAFREITNSYPDEQATVMLQRLPGLGRVNSDSSDRNFVDDFILDGLRAIDVSSLVQEGGKHVLNDDWVHPLKSLGVQILSYDIERHKTHSIFIDFVKKSIRGNKSNKVLVSDAFSALNNTSVECVDYEGLSFSDPYFGYIDFTDSSSSNVELVDGFYEKMVLGKTDPEKLSVSGGVVFNLIGVSSEKGVPKWIDGIEVENFKSIDTLTAIKSSGLNDSQNILVSILIKVYRQHGNGRLENTLVKGLSHVNNKKLKSVLSYLVSNDLLITSKDTRKGEMIYKPVRRIQGRMEKILVELDRSQDPIWIDVSKL